MLRFSLLVLAFSASAPNFRDVHSTAALITPRIGLPRGFRPRGLTVPTIPFTFAGFHEKRQVRRELVRPLRRLFAAARADGVPLAGVSGYRSEATQRELFNFYVRTRGRAQAERISARPGHSEHQTGLALDVSGADGRCQAAPCFASTRAAHWLDRNAPDHGFIIRYPRGAAAITGYEYEPWHLRYVGVRLARLVSASGLTLEQYYGVAAGL